MAAGMGEWCDPDHSVASLDEFLGVGRRCGDASQRSPGPYHAGMATLTTTVLVDDLDGSTEGVETVSLALDGAQFEIDLSAENAARLRAKLAKFIDAATHITSHRTGKITKLVITTPNGKEQTRAIRDWASQNGFEVSDRGRIPGNVLAAFNEVH